MTRLVQGGEILTAVEASALRAEEVGYDEALVELGFEPSQLRHACMREAADWVKRLPVGASVGDVEALLASAEVVGVTAGVRLGRMYGGDDGEGGEVAPSERLRRVENLLRTLALAHPGTVVGARMVELADELEAILAEGEAA